MRALRPKRRRPNTPSHCVRRENTAGVSARNRLTAVTVTEGSPRDRVNRSAARRGRRARAHDNAPPVGLMARAG